ncbi:MAG: SCP2 sterol-binding domain-containing protein [Actinobacteria bacterium]|nr:SCP2 sterol-binding domain-containing protein [Actinomycetota bacterium]
MDPTSILDAGRSAIAALGADVAALLRSAGRSDIPIPGAEWTVRDAAVHLTNFSAVNADVAAGMPSPRLSVERGDVADDNLRRIADVPETDPDKLAGLVVDGVDRFLEATAGRSGDVEVTWHCGLKLGLAELAGVELAELVLHGYDMAIAVGHPWPIDPLHALIVLNGYGPAFGLVVNEKRARGLNAGFGIELRGGPAFTARFVDGQYQVEPPDAGPVDCTLSADPVAFLLVGSGRLNPLTAVALGLLSAGGDRPERALSFNQLFVYP